MSELNIRDDQEFKEALAIADAWFHETGYKLRILNIIIDEIEEYEQFLEERLDYEIHEKL